jgi:hypothetical protein
LGALYRKPAILISSARQVPHTIINKNIFSMKQLHNTSNAMIEMSRDELKSVTGGGGGLKTALLGVTIFGMARSLGVMIGCL